MTILIMLILLLGPMAILGLLGRVWPAVRLAPGQRGRIGMSLMLLFTGLGHFIRTEPMAAMLPAWAPGRVPVVLATGAVEWLAAVGLLMPGWSRPTGLCLILFLVAVFPANVHAALARNGLGGHGPWYLLIRAPLQAFLIAWTYYFAVRRVRRDAA